MTARLARAESASRRACAAAEVRIAEQVAHGGDAGEAAECSAQENAEAASRLLEAVAAVRMGDSRKRRAG